MRTNSRVVFGQRSQLWWDLPVRDSFRVLAAIHSLSPLRERAEVAAALLLTTHDMGDVERLCDRILLVDRGSLVVDGTLAGLSRTVGAERVLVVDLPTPAGGIRAGRGARPGDRGARRRGDRPTRLRRMPVTWSPGQRRHALDAVGHREDAHDRERDPSIAPATKLGRVWCWHS